MTLCKSCGAPIMWAFSEAGIRIPLDRYPENRFVPIGTTHDRFKVVKTWSSHFATCPRAAEHRKVRTLRRFLKSPSKTPTGV